MSRGPCHVGDKCHYSHAPITAEQKQNLKPPSRPGNPNSDKPDTRKGNGQGKGGGAASGAGPTRLYCGFFLRGECKHGAECPFVHLPQESFDEINKKRSRQKLKPKPKAKAKERPRLLP